MAGFVVDWRLLAFLVLVRVVHRLDDGQGEEEGNEQELYGHLEEGEVYVGIEASRCQHLFVRDPP